MAAKAEIQCTACGQRALARPEPQYEGLRKTGEVFVCTACGHRYPAREATPFAAAETGRRIFDADDRPRRPEIFKADERRHSCGWCRHFVVNPFAQRCGLTNRETEATDVCPRFAVREEPAAVPAAPPRPAASFERLFGAAPDSPESPAT